jgi:hypothetical protein
LARTSFCVTEPMRPVVSGLCHFIFEFTYPLFTK